MVGGGPSHEATAGIHEGDVVDGKYRIDKVLGAGGMGVVMAAHHIHLDERVAIKFMLPEALHDPAVVARFAREGRAAIKVKSEHAVRVFDVGTLDNGLPYLVMEFLDGQNLADWIRERGALPVEEAVEFTLQACEALAEAHGLGIVHRDLKPSNLFVVRGADGLDSIKLLDFGISKVADWAGGFGPDLAMTRPNAVLGSPLYMSPEQMASSSSVDLRSDIWSIGVILYEVLTGQRPFNGNNLPEVCLRVSTQEPPKLSALRPDAPAEIEAVVLRCLAKKREQRYRHVGELAEALAPFGHERALASAKRIARLIQHSGQSFVHETAPPPVPAAGGATSTWVRTLAPLAGRRALLGTVALVVTASVIAILIFTRRSARRDITSSPEQVHAAAPSAVVSIMPKLDEPAPAAMPTKELTSPRADDLRPPPSAAPATSSRGAKRTLPKPTPPAALPPKAAPDCEPPFTIDGAGVKHPKLECL